MKPMTMSKWTLLFCVGALSCALPATAHANYNVYNYTAETFDILIQPGSLSLTNIGPGWHILPPLSAIDSMRATSTTAHLNFQATVIADLDGSLTIKPVSRPWGVPTQFVLESWDFGSALLDISDVSADDQVRDISFLASADCQYWWDDEEGADEYRAIANATHTQVFQTLAANPEHRGVIFAGDLTQVTRVDEIAVYDASIAGNEHFVYDSVGNHDLHWTGNDFLEACWGDDDDDCSDPYNIISRIINRHHTTVKTNQSTFSVNQYDGSTIAPLYSWDWHDVHFVQLGLVPGMGNSQGTLHDDISGGSGDPFPTFDSLAFLQADLAAHVGTSGRPVVLIHHYYLGSSDFATVKSFTEGERVAYWNVIRDYNVVAILAGHSHPAVWANWRYQWERPVGGTGGPSYIETFVVGAARGPVQPPYGDGAFTEIHINGANQMQLVRLGDDGTEHQEYTFAFGSSSTPLVVDASHPSPGVGYGQPSAPFKAVAQAHDAIASSFEGYIPPAGTLPSIVEIHAGSYDEALVFTEAMTLTASGGAVVIGQ